MCVNFITHQGNQFFFNHLSNVLDNYTKNYDGFLLADDFKADDFELCLSEFLHSDNIVKEKSIF